VGEGGVDRRALTPVEPLVSVISKPYLLSVIDNTG